LIEEAAIRNRNSGAARRGAARFLLGGESEGAAVFGGLFRLRVVSDLAGGAENPHPPKTGRVRHPAEAEVTFYQGSKRVGHTGGGGPGAGVEVHIGNADGCGEEPFGGGILLLDAGVSRWK
jgi:hypothetical protein